MSPNIQCIIVLQFEMHKQKPHPKNISLLLPHSIFPQLGCKKKWLFPTKAAMSCTQCVLDSSPKDILTIEEAFSKNNSNLGELGLQYTLGHPKLLKSYPKSHIANFTNNTATFL